MRPLTFPFKHHRVWQAFPLALALCLVASAMLLFVSLEAAAKPKAPRTGMHDCSVGELEAIDHQMGRSFNDDCIIDGGTMYCDSAGFSCCKTSANGAEVCSGQDWGGKPAPKNLPSTPVEPGTHKAR